MKIKTLVKFSGVPTGTTGEAELDGNLWKITWDLTHDMKGNPRFKPLVDWFDNQEFERFLKKI